MRLSLLVFVCSAKDSLASLHLSFLVAKLQHCILLKASHSLGDLHKTHFAHEIRSGPCRSLNVSMNLLIVSKL